MYLQPLQTDQSPHTQQMTPSPSTPTTSTSPQTRPRNYDPIDPSSSPTYPSTKQEHQPIQQHTPSNEHNADDDTPYNDEHYDDGEGEGGDLGGEEGNYAKRNRTRTRVDPTPCKICGRSYRYRKPHFMRYHPQWAGATDYEVERGGSGMVAQNVSGSSHNATAQLLNATQLHNGSMGHPVSPGIPPPGRGHPSMNGYMSVTPQGELGMRRPLLDSARERTAEGEIGRVIRRTTGPSLPLSSPSGDYAAFTAVNRPARSDTEQTDEEREWDGESYLKRVHGRNYGDGEGRVTPPRSNGVQESRKRDLDSLMNAQPEGGVYKKARVKERHSDVVVAEPKAQWEKMLDAIRSAPELDAGQKRGLVYELFKEHIKAAGRESSMKLPTPSVERQDSVEDTSVKPL